MQIIYIALMLVVGFMLALITSFVASFIYLYIKGYRFKKRAKKQRQKKKSVFYRLLVQFPLQFMKDRFNRDPDEFNEFGLHLFCGEQGSGKTVSVVDKLMKLKGQYGQMTIRTNFDYIEQDSGISDWKELVKNENGIYGQAEVIDEIQTWFNSMQSKNFPPEMITEVSQQRKQRKMIIGTAQIFGRVAKPIREQTAFVYCPLTVFGCITIVRVTKPVYYDEATFKFKRYLKTYFFVHTDEIRNAFDTYKKIEGLTASGFQLHPDMRPNNK